MLSQASMRVATMPNILGKDVEQNTLSQASMLLATMPKQWYLQRFDFVVRTEVKQDTLSQASTPW